MKYSAERRGWPCFLLPGLRSCSYFLIECVAAVTSKAEKCRVVITEREKGYYWAWWLRRSFLSLCGWLLKSVISSWASVYSAHVYLHKHFAGNLEREKWFIFQVLWLIWSISFQCIPFLYPVLYLFYHHLTLADSLSCKREMWKL